MYVILGVLNINTKIFGEIHVYIYVHNKIKTLISLMN